ncbi:putative repeat protein (TIGR03833 family) [Scopulibacillus darangshiensis]|uniref:Putative repeat protein (TIGR03833 family) n=1 Tax=Scopulibacillus darangshiensis TaxID=442528 RepID=A0A4R2NGV4_9BACL|nr:YwbE family protein [Scopulibacillus darangshiensis]TCP20344.1 putative repeat protein (TIGR03833 family) [Scopulibacillus darangshiensis]
MDGKNRKNIHSGLQVDIVLKKDQRTGKRTRGIVKDILTNSSFHPHGVKVRLEDGQIGRVQEIIDGNGS